MQTEPLALLAYTVEGFIAAIGSDRIAYAEALPHDLRCICLPLYSDYPGVAFMPCPPLQGGGGFLTKPLPCLCTLVCLSEHSVLDLSSPLGEGNHKCNQSHVLW